MLTPIHFDAHTPLKTCEQNRTVYYKGKHSKKQITDKETERVLKKSSQSQGWKTKKVHQPSPQTVNGQIPTIIKVEETIDLKPSNSLIPTVKHVQIRKTREFSQAHKDKLKQGKFLAKKIRENRVKQQLEEIVRDYFTPKAQTNNKKVEIKAIEQLQTLLQAFMNGRCLEDLLTWETIRVRLINDYTYKKYALFFLVMHYLFQKILKHVNK